MNHPDVTVKQHPVHHVDSVSGEVYKKARRKHPAWGAQILQLLQEGDATTLMLARRLGCQSSDITQPVLELRKLGVICDAGVGRDPHTHHRAHYWTLKKANSGQPASNAA